MNEILTLEVIVFSWKIKAMIMIFKKIFLQTSIAIIAEIFRVRIEKTSVIIHDRSNK